MAIANSLEPLAGNAPFTETVPPDWPHARHSRQVESFGTRWHVQQMGSGPQMLLVHGTAASTHSYRELMPLLAERFSVIAVDIPGHGFSSRLPDRNMSLNAIARGLFGLIETLGLRPRFFVGHSAGAAIVLRHALDHPHGIEAVVGLNAALLPYGGVFRNLFTPMASFFASTRLMPMFLSQRAADKKAVERVIRGTGSVLDANGIHYYQSLFQNEEHLGAVLAMMAAWDLSELNRDLARLAPRLLLVSGGRDRAVSPNEANKVASRLSKAEVIEYEDCGHLAHEEHPRRIAATVERFCLESGGGGDAAD